MTVKERIHGIVDELDEVRAARALELLEELANQGNRPPRASSVGAIEGPTDLSERVDELLAEGFGRQRLA